MRRSNGGFVLGLSAIAWLGSVGAACQAATRPPTTSSAARPQPVRACAAPAPASPFTAALSADERTELELALGRGAVVVAYDCRTLRVLKDCRAEGEYSYLGTSLQEQALQISAADTELNLPRSPVTLSRGTGAAAISDVELRVALVGKRTASAPTAWRADLRGDCAGATHFVRAAQVGAFTLRAGTAPEALATGGALDACRVPTESAARPRADCAAPIRLELRPILDRNDTTALVEDAVGPQCPAGAHADDQGRCVSARAAGPYTCAFQDVQDCERQCRAGSAASCSLLARSYQLGRGVAKDEKRAIELLHRRRKLGRRPSEDLYPRKRRSLSARSCASRGGRGVARPAHEHLR